MLFVAICRRAKMRNEMNEHRGAAHHTVAKTASSRVMSTDRLALHTLLVPLPQSSRPCSRRSGLQLCCCWLPARCRRSRRDCLFGVCSLSRSRFSHDCRSSTGITAFTRSAAIGLWCRPRSLGLPTWRTRRLDRIGLSRGLRSGWVHLIHRFYWRVWQCA